MLQERVGAKHRTQDGPKGSAINGILYAMPVAAILWVAIAGIIYLLVI
jgi:hypothetical protein